LCVGCCTVEDCIVKYHYTNNVYCGAAGTPGAGSCHCDAGLTACVAEPYPTVICTDLDTDSLNCGVCYNVCPEGFPLCRNGLCKAA
jgi:hypothetical protein